MASITKNRSYPACEYVTEGAAAEQLAVRIPTPHTTPRTHDSPKSGYWVGTSHQSMYLP